MLSMYILFVILESYFVFTALLLNVVKCFSVLCLFACVKHIELPYVWNVPYTYNCLTVKIQQLPSGVADVTTAPEKMTSKSTTIRLKNTLSTTFNFDISKNNVSTMTLLMYWASHTHKLKESISLRKSSGHQTCIWCEKIIGDVAGILCIMSYSYLR